jgi:MYXO-CTERM domain-containing protein
MLSKRKLKAALLATTCLTAVATGGAQAGIVNETIFGDFSNDPDNPTSLPVLTTVINGAHNDPDAGSDPDFFKLNGLTIGQSVTVELLSHTDFDIALCLQEASGPCVFDAGQSFSFSPTSTMAVLSVQSESGTGNYSIGINLPSNDVPLAPTSALLGLGLAGLALRRRKHT